MMLVICRYKIRFKIKKDLRLTECCVGGEILINISFVLFYIGQSVGKVRKRAKIRNRLNQAPHLTQDTNGKVTTSQFDITNESQEVSRCPAGDHKVSINRRTWKNNKKDRNNINDPQKKHRLGTVSKNILLEGLNRFHSVPNSPIQM